MKSLSPRFALFIVPLRIAAVLGGAWYSADRWLILLRSYVFLFKKFLGNASETLLWLHFKGMRFPVRLTSSVELALIREVFLDHEYEHPALDNPQVIFDVGANIGLAAIYFACLYPQATVYAFEADPDVFERLKHQTASFANIRPMHVALGGTDGTRQFFVHPESILSGSLIERVSGQRSVEVESVRISTFADREGIKEIDLIKFDIEGGEKELFLHAEDRTRARMLVGEVHLDILNMSLDEFASLFPESTGRYTRHINERRSLFLALRNDHG